MGHMDGIVAATLSLASSLSYAPQPGKFTILASFTLVSHASTKIISMASGSKCLPTDRLPVHGDALHDSHAEVLARRGAMRWFFEEVLRDAEAPSKWICRDANGMYALRDGVRLCLYVSTPPCGDASTRLLASTQDPSIALLKDSTPWPVLPPGTASRGRDDYGRLGVLRTKPGRADAPPVLSMACSDKIARWNVLGMQGALASDIFCPIYVSAIVIGEVAESVREEVKADCERAFWGRIGQLNELPTGYRVASPEVYFTSIPFAYSKSAVFGSTTGSSSNDSLSWIADSKWEILINGLRRGVPPKHRSNDKFWPLLSKISLYKLYITVWQALGRPLPLTTLSYHAAKQTVTSYQDAKRALVGATAPFSGWVSSGATWEGFDAGGTVQPS